MITVEEALPDDADAVWKFLQGFATSHVPSREAFNRDFPRLVANDGSDLLIARSAGVTAGYLLAYRNLTLFAGGTILEILELYVDENFRGEGIGRALVRSALDRASAAGCIEAVVPTRRATGFYEELGFEPSATYLKLRSLAPIQRS